MASSVFIRSGAPFVMSLLVFAVSMHSTVSQTCFFSCGGVCLSPSDMCNGFTQCPDGLASDERNCTVQTDCPLGFEKCPTTALGTHNACIHPQWRCDGDNDCGDYSDEDMAYCRDTPCPSTMVKCTDSYQCLPGFAYCNGVQNCVDGSDEPPACSGPNFTCPTDHFKCVNSQRCIPDVWICDTEDDCGDNSDEDEDLHSCSSHTCDSTYYFTCPRNRPGHSRCIPFDLLCDGSSHCEHAEDEDLSMCGTPQPCEFYEFTCDNNLCIPIWYQCDHDNDCGDGSDETASCFYPTCVFGQFTCNNGRCISSSQRCDSFDHCRDNSDEEDCSCEDGQFQCLNKQCIDESVVCNQINDCTDSSDEGNTCNINECSSADYMRCSNACVDEPLTYHCTCPSGYVLDTDEHTCIDLNECEQTPWVCDQTCNNIAGSYSCDCVLGFVLSSDGTNCTIDYGGEPYLVFTNRYYIRRLGVEVNSTDYTLIARGFDLVVALDFDYVEGKLYFSDVRNKSIYRMDFDGTNLETIHDHDVVDVEGLAVDWVTKKLYWNDRVRDLMEVSELDGSNRLAIIDSGLFEPRDLAVDPGHGHAYWADWGLRPYIGRVGMDGSDKIELHDESVGWPNGLTIDYPSGTVYWVDAHLDYVAFSDLNFNYIHRLLHDEYRHTIAHPFGISVFGDYIYMTDWNLKKVFKAHKYTGDEVELKTLVHRPFSIHVVHPLRQSRLNNICSNSPCMGLCLIAPGGTSYTCACAENYVLSGYNCIPLCPSGQVACNGEHKCIPWYRQCNGINDCVSGSDEVNCPPRRCQPGQYECNDGSCLYSILWLCDGDRDCPDNSDEGTAARCTMTECESWQFKCQGTGACISRRLVCNQNDDCGDGSDEADTVCRTHVCSEGYFQCDNGFCIPLEWKCDWDDDCGDRSDEPHRECQDTPCPVGWISCQTTYRCIPEYARCNGYDECRDGSDEIGCAEVTCDPLGEFRCSNHRCIPQRWYCDFDNDCGDFSDEPQGCEPRPCSESEFRCVSRGRCIRDRWRCDGSPDCSDGSDEEGCEGPVCRPDQFQCNIGGCIAANLTCNRFSDCIDHSDEFNCNNVVCRNEEFRCSNRLCIPKSQLCDTYEDCGDGSDETYTACQDVVCEPSALRCIVGLLLKCLPGHKRCDGVTDCHSREDEQNCEAVCTAETFKCQNGQCITWDKVCDKNSDCTDKSDENPCYKTRDECQTFCQKECIFHVLSSSFICSCGQGLVETENGCQDINECYLQNPCPQLCINIKGGYKCLCGSGFVREDAGCKAVGEREEILFGDGSEVRKYIPGLDEYLDLVVNEVRVESLDFDFNTGSVYFTDSELRAVKKISINNTGAAEAPDHLGLDNVYRPVGIAVDWLGNNIYFTDQGLPPDDTIRGKRAAADRGPKVVVVALKVQPYHEKTLHQAEIPYAIAVNPRRGLMYWTDVGKPASGSRLFMSWMNGQFPMPVDVAAGKLDQPTGLSVDYTANDTVYWCDYRVNKIGYITYDGSRFVILKTLGELNNPFQLDVFGNLIYWTTKSPVRRGMINTMNKTGGENQVLLSGINLPTGIKVWQEQRYPLTVPNPCQNNPCLYMCLIQPQLKGFAINKGFQCVCPSGVTADSNNCNGSPCTCENGGKCRADGTCDCPPNFTGSSCGSIDKQIGDGIGGTSVALVAGLVAFIFIALIVIVILLFVFLKKRRKFNGPVTYRDGQNVDMHPPPPGREVEPNGIYETTLAPQDPVTFQNPAYANTMGAVGGGAVTGLPDKPGLPYNPAMYQPGYQAEALPQKAYLADGTPVDQTSVAMQAHYPEPPPAYSPNNPPPPEPKDPNQSRE